MTRRAWPQDTIARRFALAVIFSVAGLVGLVFLLKTLAGPWGNEPLEDSKLLREADDMIRIIQAAPLPLRPRLAEAAWTTAFQVNWYEANSLATVALENSAGAVHKRVSDELTETFHRTAMAFRPDDTLADTTGLVYDRQRYPDAYFLAVRLDDASWMVFTALSRSWGIPIFPRVIISLLLLAISATIVSLHASRRLSGPIERLAEAAREFGANPHAPPMIETGPRELRQMIHTFNAMQAQIQKFLTYRVTMLAAISHDLRTPLTRMRLRGEYIEDSEQQQRLFRDVDEMRTMVDGALAFFRDDAAGEETVLFDLPGVLRTVANDYADQGIDIGYEGPARTACRGRPFALKRAVTNLVENAIKYATPPEISLHLATDCLVVTVADRGPGIPETLLQKVFNPYYRLDKSRNRATGGVGLGLTSAQAVVQGHGGDIVLENRPDGGLEARIILPTP